MKCLPALLEPRRYRFRDGWAELLAHYPWEWFVTLTLKVQMHREAAAQGHAPVAVDAQSPSVNGRSPFLRVYFGLKLLAGLRRGDLLSLKVFDLREDGIYVTPRKTAHSKGKKIIIAWSQETRDAIQSIMQLRRKVTSIWLFHTNRGQSYVKPDGAANGFDSIWQRFIQKALTRTNLVERFTEHDLRAKVASDANAYHASQLLGHSSIAVTNRAYRRKNDIVKPLG